jgi:hypothetical protein
MFKTCPVYIFNEPLQAQRARRRKEERRRDFLSFLLL